MRPREKPLDAAVTRFVADFVALIEGHVAHAIDEALAMSGARPPGTRRKHAAASDAPRAKIRRGRKPPRAIAPTAKTTKAAKAAKVAKSAKPARKKVAKTPSPRAEQLTLF